MAKSEQEQAQEVLRQIENRLVWLGTFLVMVRGYSIESSTSTADKALDEYQTRFPPINPG